MNKLFVILICSMFSWPVLAQCENESLLLELDAEFEVAMNSGFLSYFEQVLHPDFVWVHDHASLIQQSKSEFFDWFTPISKRIGNSPSGTREQRDIEVIISANTSIVYGYIDILRGGQNLIYHFMRTYVNESSECLLLSNHTMEINDAD